MVRGVTTLTAERGVPQSRRFEARQYRVCWSGVMP